MEAVAVSGGIVEIVNTSDFPTPPTPPPEKGSDPKMPSDEISAVNGNFMTGIAEVPRKIDISVDEPLPPINYETQERMVAYSTDSAHFQYWESTLGINNKTEYTLEHILESSEEVTARKGDHTIDYSAIIDINKKAGALVDVGTSFKRIIVLDQLHCRVANVPIEAPVVGSRLPAATLSHLNGLMSRVVRNKTGQWRGRVNMQYSLVGVNTYKKHSINCLGREWALVPPETQVDVEFPICSSNYDSAKIQILSVFSTIMDKTVPTPKDIAQLNAAMTFAGLPKIPEYSHTMHTNMRVVFDQKPRFARLYWRLIILYIEALIAEEQRGRYIVTSIGTTKGGVTTTRTEDGFTTAVKACIQGDNGIFVTDRMTSECKTDKMIGILMIATTETYRANHRTILPQLWVPIPSAHVYVISPTIIINPKTVQCPLVLRARDIALVIDYFAGYFRQEHLIAEFLKVAMSLIVTPKDGITLPRMGKITLSFPPAALAPSLALALAERGEHTRMCNSILKLEKLLWVGIVHRMQYELLMSSIMEYSGIGLLSVYSGEHNRVLHNIALQLTGIHYGVSVMYVLAQSLSLRLGWGCVISRVEAEFDVASYINVFRSYRSFHPVQWADWLPFGRRLPVTAGVLGLLANGGGVFLQPEIRMVQFENRPSSNVMRYSDDHGHFYPYIAMLKQHGKHNNTGWQLINDRLNHFDVWWNKETVKYNEILCDEYHGRISVSELTTAVPFVSYQTESDIVWAQSTSLVWRNMVWRVISGWTPRGFVESHQFMLPPEGTTFDKRDTGYRLIATNPSTSITVGTTFDGDTQIIPNEKPIVATDVRGETDDILPTTARRQTIYDVKCEDVFPAVFTDNIATRLKGVRVISDVAGDAIKKLEHLYKRVMDAVTPEEATKLDMSQLWKTFKNLHTIESGTLEPQTILRQRSNDFISAMSLERPETILRRVATGNRSILAFSIREGCNILLEYGVGQVELLSKARNDYEILSNMMTNCPALTAEEFAAAEMTALAETNPSPEDIVSLMLSIRDVDDLFMIWFDPQAFADSINEQRKMREKGEVNNNGDQPTKPQNGDEGNGVQDCDDGIHCNTPKEQDDRVDNGTNTSHESFKTPEIKNVKKRNHRRRRRNGSDGDGSSGSNSSCSDDTYKTARSKHDDDESSPEGKGCSTNNNQSDAKRTGGTNGSGSSHKNNNEGNNNKDKGQGNSSKGSGEKDSKHSTQRTQRRSISDTKRALLHSVHEAAAKGTTFGGTAISKLVEKVQNGNIDIEKDLMNILNSMTQQVYKTFGSNKETYLDAMGISKGYFGFKRAAIIANMEMLECKQQCPLNDTIKRSGFLMEDMIRELRNLHLIRKGDEQFVNIKTIIQLRHQTPKQRLISCAVLMPGATVAEELREHWIPDLDLRKYRRKDPEIWTVEQLFDYKSYNNAPPGLRNIFQIEGRWVAEVCRDYSPCRLEILRHVAGANHEMYSYELAALFLWWLFLPSSVYEHFVLWEWYKVDVTSCGDVIAELCNRTRMVGVGCGCKTGSDIAHFLRKFGNLKGRRIGDADWLEEAENGSITKTNRSYGTPNGSWSRNKYLLKFEEVMSHFVNATVQSRSETGLINLNNWWAKRQNHTPGGSTSERLLWKAMEHENLKDDSCLTGADRPNKKAVAESLPADYPWNVLKSAAIMSERCSTKNEPGLKQRALHAASDECTTIASYASEGIEKAMSRTKTGLMPLQEPTDVAEWLSWHYDRLSRQVMVSADFKDFNKEHSIAELIMVHLLMAKAYTQSGHGQPAIEKALCSAWMAIATYNRIACNPIDDIDMMTGGLWSGTRDTARDNTFFNRTYLQLCADWLDESYVTWGNVDRIATCGDDSVLRASDGVAAFIIVNTLAQWWNLNPKKQMCSLHSSEFLQQMPDAVHGCIGSACSMIAAMCSGQWYKAKGPSQDTAIDAISSQCYELGLRTDNMTLARMLAIRSLQAYMRVQNDEGGKDRLEWWKFRHCVHSLPQQYGLFNEPEYSLNIHPLWCTPEELDGKAPIKTQEAPRAFWEREPTGPLNDEASNAFLDDMRQHLNDDEKVEFDRHRDALLHKCKSESYGALHHTWLQKRRQFKIKKEWPRREDNDETYRIMHREVKRLGEAWHAYHLQRPETEFVQWLLGQLDRFKAGKSIPSRGGAASKLGVNIDVVQILEACGEKRIPYKVEKACTDKLRLTWMNRLQLCKSDIVALSPPLRALLLGTAT